jgi:alanine racemase
VLTLRVDERRWRHHLEHVRDENPGLVPVAKGNGYGFGLGRLAEVTEQLGLDTLAVGTYAEVPVVEQHFGGSLLVLSPWREFETRATYDPRLIHTVGRVGDVRALAASAGPHQPRVALELLTSMRRHGFTARELREAAPLTSGLHVEGFALHLPMDQGSHVGEVERLLTDVVASGIDSRTVWVSHLSTAELAALRTSYADFDLRPRVGTQLWLGDRGALTVTSTVLDVHAVERGDVFGYRGRSAPRNGHILVVSGGTAHGIGLEAPTGGATLRDRAARVAKGGLDAAGFVRSPFTVGGKQRLFAEPPHMQASMLFLPADSAVPEIGAEVTVRVRFTATSFDQIEMC